MSTDCCKLDLDIVKMSLRVFLIFCIIYLFQISIYAQEVELNQLVCKSELYYKNDSLYTGHFYNKEKTCPAPYATESELLQEGEIVNGKREGNFVFKNTKGEIIGGGKYLDNKKEGFWVEITWRIAGDCGMIYYKSSGNYHLGKKNGIWKEKGRCSDCFAEGEYVSGAKEGFWIEAFRGVDLGHDFLKHEGNYSNGMKTGEWKSIYLDTNSTYDKVSFGKLAQIKNYNNDSLEGRYVHYWYPEKKKYICEEGFYKNNKKDSVWKTYNKYKQVMSMGSYVNGEKDMIWVYYMVNRRMIEREEFYDEGFMVKSITYGLMGDGKIWQNVHTYIN